MGPVESVKQGLAQCLSVKGRATRAEYWWFVLFYAVVAVAVMIPLGWAGIALDELSAGGTRPGVQAASVVLRMLCVVVFLFMVPPLLCVKVRRLHDLGMSGWWFWAFMLPMSDLAWLVVSLFPSQPEGDRFGPSRSKPLAAGRSTVTPTAPAAL